MSRSVFVWRMLYLPGIKRAGNAKAERCRFASVTGASRIKEMHQVGFSTATVQRAFSWPPPEDQAEVRVPCPAYRYSHLRSQAVVSEHRCSRRKRVEAIQMAA
jgi:hypothetical protein